MKAVDGNHYLLSIRLDRGNIADDRVYPFSLPAVRKLPKLVFHPKVTFIVGENGAGKSTLLEALAIGMGFNAEGGSRNFNFATRSTHANLHEYLTLAKGLRRPRDGYFQRAETYYNLASEIDRLDEGGGGPPLRTSYGGKSLHNQSHGESFMSLFEHRFGGQGLYILDEPEAALSPARQLQFLVRLHQLVQQQSQFIIATHSPIIMAYPHADLWLVDDQGIHKTTYEDTDHYQITRQFLVNKDGMLRQLLG